MYQIPWQETHVPGRAGLLTAVGALLLAHEGVEVAFTAAVIELLALLALRIVAPPKHGEKKSTISRGGF